MRAMSTGMVAMVLAGCSTASSSTDTARPASGFTSPPTTVSSLLRVPTVEYGTRSTCAAAHGALLSFAGDEDVRAVLLDPRTLVEEPGPDPKVVGSYDGAVVGPDGCSVLIGGLGQLTRYDPIRRRIVGHWRVARNPPSSGPFRSFGPADVQPVVWPRPRRAIAYAGLEPPHSEDPSLVLVVDPVTGRTVRRINLHGTVHQAASTRDGAVFVVDGGGDGSVGARLVQVSAGGRLQSMTLSGQVAGYSDSGVVGSSFDVTPGLAVRGNRAAVISPQGLVADVDLNTMTATYHRVTGMLRHAAPNSKPETPGSAGIESTDVVTGSFAGPHDLAVSDFRERPTDRDRKIWSIGLAASVVDTRNWRVRNVVRGDSSVVTADHLIFGYRVTRAGLSDRLDVAGPGGRIRYRRYHSNSQRGWMLVAGRLLDYPFGGGRGSTELDPQTGRVVGTVGPTRGWLYGGVIPLRPGAVYVPG